MLARVDVVTFTRLGYAFDAMARTIAIALALAIVTAVAYLPAGRASFLNWDDDVMITNNQEVRTFSWESVRWALTTSRFGNPMPLTWLSHMLDYRLYGMDARGHHLTSVALHVANTVLVFFAFLALTGACWRSAVVAALFGLHPLHVEPVAWIAERKEVLSAFFFLLTLAAYARWARGDSDTRGDADPRSDRSVRGAGRASSVPSTSAGRSLSGAAVVAGFVAALAAKPMAVTLPAVLLLLDYWPLARLSRRAVREKIPLFVIAAAAALFTFVAQSAASAATTQHLIPAWDRIPNAVVSYVAYLRLALWPARLSPWYSHPALEGPRLATATVVAAAAFLVTATFLILRGARRRPHVAVGWLWYLGTLFPVIGFVQVGEHAMADRYTYIPLLGIFVLVVWEAATLPLWRAPAGRSIGALVTVAALGVLAILTWRQVGIWHDPTTFWTATIAANPRSGVAHYEMGGLFFKRGDIDGAIAEYRRALKLRPDFVYARGELGNFLAGKGRLAAAAAQYRKAIAGRPQAAEDESNLANVLLSMGNTAAARRHLERALAIRPDFAEAHNNLGIVLAQSGQMDDAIVHFRAAVAVQPNFGAARQNLALALAQQGRSHGTPPAP